MIASKAPFYGPALRMKGGELMGLRDLAPDIADRVRPRLIVPPPAERDDALQAKLFSCEAFPDISASLAAHWAQRAVLIESTYLLDEFGRSRMGLWLPKMFEKARSGGARPIPLVALDDLLTDDLSAYRSTIDSSESLKFGIVVSSGGLTDGELVKRGIDALNRLALSPEECVVVADFHDADFTDPSIVAPVIGAVLDTLNAEARWQHIVFQGTNYPEKNPAQPNSYCIIPRNEWIAWRRAVAFDPETSEYMIFGDYAADCAKMNFGSAGSGPPIRHYRYATPDSWLVQRASDQGTNAATMRKVCESIVNSGKFAGRTFSAADDRIYRISKGGGRPGGAREWRAINTAHHITRVVTDIGDVRGIQFERKVIGAVDEQMALLP